MKTCDVFPSSWIAAGGIRLPILPCRSNNVKAGKAIRVAAKTINPTLRLSHRASVEFYLSKRRRLTDEAVPLGKKLLPALTPGKTKTTSARFIVPSDILPGEYYLISNINPGDHNRDNRMRNNVSVAAEKVIIGL